MCFSSNTNTQTSTCKETGYTNLRLPSSRLRTKFAQHGNQGHLCYPSNVNSIANFLRTWSLLTWKSRIFVFFLTCWVTEVQIGADLQVCLAQTTYLTLLCTFSTNFMTGGYASTTPLGKKTWKSSRLLAQPPWKGFGSRDQVAC